MYVFELFVLFKYVYNSDTLLRIIFLISETDVQHKNESGTFQQILNPLINSAANSSTKYKY